MRSCGLNTAPATLRSRFGIRGRELRNSIRPKAGPRKLAWAFKECKKEFGSYMATSKYDPDQRGLQCSLLCLAFQATLSSIDRVKSPRVRRFSNSSHWTPFALRSNTAKLHLFNNFS